jgi:hypothetical protein
MNAGRLFSLFSARPRTFSPGSPDIGRKHLPAAAALGLLLAVASLARADEPPTPVGLTPEAYRTTVDKGIQYLVTHGQAPDGSLSKFAGTGPTSLAVTAMLRNGRSAADPAVAKGLEYLRGCGTADGSICSPSSFAKNYETCAAIMCLREANQPEKDAALLKKAEQPSDFASGGVGYGGKSRPDLSNTSFLIDALKACGAGPQDEAIQKALVFASRCQNLETEHNTTPFAAKVNDGGFYYSCLLSREDQSRMTAEGSLRSYGSMSYAGLKSMLYAGLRADDPRVKAAVSWIRKHYDVRSNPGMGDAGLYYYYHTFAKALDTMGEDLLVDAEGRKHDWRRDLSDELARRQQPDGSWVNQNTRWMEGDPNLATAFALLALSYCRPAASK